MRHITLAVLAAVCLGGCANLLVPSGTAATRWAALEKTRAAKAAGVDVTKICKNMTVMGSNFPQKVCSTRAEWDEFDKQQLAKAEEVMAARRAGNTGSDFEN